VSLSEKIDTTSAAGRMVFRMMAVLAEFERDQISERTSAAMQHMRGKGMYTGGRAPYGFRVDSDGRLVEDDYEQAVIKEARFQARQGRGLRAIAGNLNTGGFRSRTGKPFVPTQVSRMIAA